MRRVEHRRTATGITGIESVSDGDASDSFAYSDFRITIPDLVDGSQALKRGSRRVFTFTTLNVYSVAFKEGVARKFGEVPRSPILWLHVVLFCSDDTFLNV